MGEELSRWSVIVIFDNGAEEAFYIEELEELNNITDDLDMNEVDKIELVYNLKY